MYYHPVIARQMLGCQRRPEILIAGLHLLQHRRPELRCVGPVRHAPAVPMLQCFRSSSPISCPHPFRLPITQLQQLRRFAQPQTVRLHPTHHFHSTQLFPAQSRSPQSRFLLDQGTLKGDTSNGFHGDTFNVVQQPLYMMVTLRSVTRIPNQNSRVVRHKNHSTVARTSEMSVYYTPVLKSRRNTG